MQKTSIPNDLFEEFIIKKVIGELNKPEAMNKLLNRILDIQSSKTKIDEQIQILEREQQRAKIAYDNLMKNAEQYVVSQAVHDRIKELEDQIATLEKKYRHREK